jgi:hypothetical protein
LRVHALPFDALWFAPAARTQPPHARRGRLDLNDLVLKRKLHAAAGEAQRLRQQPQR